MTKETNFSTSKFISNIPIIKNTSEQVAKLILSVSKNHLDEIRDATIESGRNIWIILTNETTETYGLSVNRIRINRTNCRGYNFHENGTIDVDISINGRGGWYTFTEEEYEAVGVEVDGGYIIDIVALVHHSLVEGMLETIRVDLNEDNETKDLSKFESSGKRGLLEKEGSVLKVNFGKGTIDG